MWASRNDGVNMKKKTLAIVVLVSAVTLCVCMKIISHWDRKLRTIELPYDTYLIGENISFNFSVKTRSGETKFVPDFLGGLRTGRTSVVLFSPDGRVARHGPSDQHYESPIDWVPISTDRKTLWTYAMTADLLLSPEEAGTNILRISLGTKGGNPILTECQIDVVSPPETSIIHQIEVDVSGFWWAGQDGRALVQAVRLRGRNWLFYKRVAGPYMLVTRRIGELNGGATFSVVDGTDTVELRWVTPAGSTSTTSIHKQTGVPD